MSSMNRPTAQTLLPEDAATAYKLLPEPGLGLATWAHFWPFQCRIRDNRVVPLSSLPTAQALSAAVVTAPKRKLVPGAVPAAIPFRIVSRAGPPGLGLATWAHFWPFQCRVRLRSALPLKNVPTAQALVAEMAGRPDNTPST